MKPLLTLGPGDVLRLAEATVRRMARQQAEKLVRDAARAEQEALLNEQPELLDIVSYRRACSAKRKAQ